MMGNRAVIAFGSGDDDIGIYLHWNGGVESVLAFLKAAETLGHRDPTQDSYGIARMCQLIGNYFGGTLSLGVDTLSRLDTDNFDNGTFYVGSNFTIAERKYNRGDNRKSLADLDDKAREYYEGVLSECLKRNKEREEAAK